MPDAVPDAVPDPLADPALLHEATQRLVRTVDGLPGEELATPSLLPGWTRGHVVAHLALNAEALAGCLEGLLTGDPTPMYPSQERRDADIDELAGSGPTELRERLLSSTTRFAEAAEAMTERGWSGHLERVHDGPTFPADQIPLMRWREVEIHHADLEAGYSAADWSPGFAVAVLDSAARRPWPAPFRAWARDLDRTFVYGDPTAVPGEVPTVSGECRDLAWWITGRGHGAGLTAHPHPLPEVPAW